MTIEELLKNPDYGARIATNNAWLFWECSNSLTNDGQWVVLYKPESTKRDVTLYEGTDLSESLKALILKGE